MTKRVRIALIAVVLMLLAAAFGSVTTAQAGTFTSHRCNDLAPGDDWYWDLRGITVWGLFADGCPDPITLQLYGGVPIQQDEYSAHYDYGIANSPIVSATVSMSGSNGLDGGMRQGIRFCGETCSPIHMRSSENPDEVETLEFSVEDGTIPEGADLIVIAAECVNPDGCGGGDFEDPETWPPALRIHEIELTHLDETPPYVYADWFPESGLWGRFGWINQAVRHRLAAFDRESGLVYAWSTFGPDETLVDECGDAESNVLLQTECPDPSQYPDPVIPKEWLTQGVNYLQGHARDRAGNVASHTSTFKFDSIPPSRPSGLVLEPGRVVWVNDLEAFVEWNNTGETVETEVLSGIYAARIDIDPIDAGLSNQPPVVIEQDEIDRAPIEFPSNGNWTVSVETIDRAGNVSPMASLPVEVDDEKPGPASFSALQPITAADRVTGRTIDWDWTSVGQSGICGSAFDVNGLSNMNPGDDPDNPTIAGDVSQRTLTTGQIDAIGDGLKYVHVRAFSCAGRGSDVGREPIQVDTSPPTVRLEPANGWLSPGDGARLIADDVSDKGEQSGVAEIEYTIGGATKSVSAASTTVEAPAGAHQITFSAVDGVGNRSSIHTGTVRTDAQSPNAWLSRPPIEDPTLLGATAQDPESGVKELWVEMKPASGGAPILLGDKHRVESPSSAEVSIERRIPDDALAGSGLHLIEVHAVDATGKHTVSRTWRDGSSAELTMPIRPRPSIEVEIGSPAAGFSRLHRSPFGARRSIRGRLVQPGGQPVAGAVLALRGEMQGRAQTEFGRVTTATDGTFTSRIDATSGRRVIAAFAGTPQLGPATASAELKVSSGVAASPSRRRIRGGRTLIVRGRVHTGDANLPERGKLVALQFKMGPRWSSLTPTSYTFDDGRFTIPFKFKSRRRTTRVAFRVVVPTEAGWPFERGQSREFKVVFIR